MREIVPGIATWPWYSARMGYDFHGFFVRHDEGNLCIDPVESSEDDLERLAERGVKTILLTNRNHYRDAARVRERTGARVAVHPADAAFVRDHGVAVDESLVHGERRGPFLVVPVAGKSPGEVALYWAERRLLLVGDACIGSPAGRLGLLPDQVMDDPAGLRQSLRRLAAEFDFETLLLADGESLLRGGRAALQRLVASAEP